MNRITCPTQTVRSTLDLCVSRIENCSLRARAELIAAELEAGEVVYSKQAKVQSLYSIQEQDHVGQLTDKEMLSLYDERLSRRGHPARKVYDSLRAAAKFNLCPLCGQRQVATLDHYLPQSSHPLFAITPINLVPCCSDCNKAKLAKFGRDAASQTFHPYFDNFDDGVWLAARVIEVNHPAVSFSVALPDGWNEIKFRRASHHFSLLGLAELYGSNAAQELAQISQGLKELREASGPSEVHRHLQHQALSRGANKPNSWQAAMYAGLARSEWFCQGGHLSIQD